MAHDVFISYSTKDKVTADAVCATLELNSVRCWIAPRDILPGMEYAEALIEALHSSRLLVLVFSSGANASLQVRQEVERAVSRGIPVLPFRIEDVPPNRAMEFYISGRHWLDALTPPLEAHLNELARTVKLLLSRTQDPPPITATLPVLRTLQQPAPPPGAMPPPPVAPPLTTEPRPQQQAAAPATGPPPVAPPYVPPQGTIAPPSGGSAVVAPPAPGLPKWLVMTKQQALKHIRNAWIAGLVSAVVTFITILVSVNGGDPIAGMHVDWSNLLDVGLMLGLTFGTYRKVRWCAISLFGLFILEKVFQWSQAGPGNAFAIILTVAFFYFFFQGVRGASAYRTMKGVWNQAAHAA
jgi:hypothetical protein